MTPDHPRVRLATAKTVRDPHATGCVGHDHRAERSTTITRRTSVDPDLPDWLVWLLDHRLLLVLLAIQVVTIGAVLR